MSKKSLSSTLCALLFLAACGPGSTVAPNPNGDGAPDLPTAVPNSSATTILRFAVSQMGQGRYDNLIDAFEAENPGVHIATVPIEQTLGVQSPGADWPDDAYLLLAAAADVIDAPATRQAVQQGALLDLTQFFESDSTLTPDSFYPGLLESVQWEGRIWSVPAQANYQLIYFDKRLFDAAGIPYPEPGWIWDDFLTTAKALTIGRGDETTQWGFVQPVFDPATLVQSYAGLLFDPETSPPTAKLNTPATIEAVRWVTDLFRVHAVAPYFSQSQEGGPGRMFANEAMRLLMGGQAAMWTGMPGFVVRLDGPDQEQTNIGTVPFPVHDPGDRSTPAVVDGYSISAGTKKAELAWKWISYLVQQQGGQPGRFDLMMGSAVPALPSVAAAGGTWNRLDEGTAAALKYAIDHAYVDTYDGPGIDRFYNAVVDVMDNGTAIEIALASAQTQAEDEIEAEVAASPTPVTGLVVAEKEEKALNAGAVIIQFGMSESGFGRQSFATLVDQFQEAHPDIVVELGAPQGFRGGLSLAEMAGEYDCFQASPSFSNESLAAILNMEPFLAADSTIRKEDFYLSVLAQFTYHGQVWGIPGSVSSITVINYNKDLFDAAGIPYPTADWTTSDMLDAAVALTKGDGETKQYGYVGGFFELNDVIALMDRQGVQLLDESVDPARFVLNAPQVAQAFRWYTDLTIRYGVKPVFENSDDPGEAFQHRQTLIDQGRAAMWMESGGGFAFGGRGFGEIRFSGDPQASDLNVGVVPLPLGTTGARGGGFQSVNGYFISAQTGAREACWSWITFLSGQPNAGAGLPARRDVAESDAYRQQVGSELADAYIASISGGSQSSFYQRLSDRESWLSFAAFWLSDAYNHIVNEEMTVEEALDAAQEKVDAYRDCVIANDAFDDPEVQRQCATEMGGSTLGGPPPGG